MEQCPLVTEATTEVRAGGKSVTVSTGVSAVMGQNVSLTIVALSVIKWDTGPGIVARLRRPSNHL